MTCLGIATFGIAVGRWFPPGTPVSSTRKLIQSSSFHRLDMTLAVAEALTPNKPSNQTTFGMNNLLLLGILHPVSQLQQGHTLVYDQLYCPYCMLHHVGVRVRGPGGGTCPSRFGQNSGENSVQINLSAP